MWERLRRDDGPCTPVIALVDIDPARHLQNRTAMGI
jgi:hypothetical protein